ncbi:molybdopterin biosynthesis protein [Pinisolibacter sp.]|uniref:molybdopterin biosynthesis protein n=1 Tax=Pinisolibacter sp. TaxID=2172024 RepID=UPI002FDDCAC8
MKQDQFLTVLGRDEALARFEAALAAEPVGVETVPLAAGLGRVVAENVVPAIDVPPFDRSTMDGFAVRAADVASASEVAPVTLRLTGETIACGTAPKHAVAAGMATVIATGGPIPRGADAVVPVEWTEPGADGAVVVRRAVASGQNLAYAGSDLARGEVLLRRGSTVGSREIGMMAACGIGSLAVFRRPKVAVISTGDELVQPGEALRPAAIYDSNGPIVAAAVAENGGEAVAYGAIPDDEEKLRAALHEALATCDMVILSGGTSKGAGDYTARLVGELGSPGIVAHGVALKPGKPLCLAVCEGKAVVVLPGFPTSAMFTFHEFVVPSLRRLAGLPARAEAKLDATVPVRVPSDRGRTEFVMVSLGEGPEGERIAHPVFKGSGSISAFAQADGFVMVDALADQMPAGTLSEVTLFSPDVRIPDLVIAGSHCVGLEPIIDRLAAEGWVVRVLALGSLGGIQAAKRGECDIAPTHLLHAETGAWNRPYLGDDIDLVEGWRRVQGIVHRPGDPRFEGKTVTQAIETAASAPDCLMVNRNQGAGTRILLDGLLAGRRPEGYFNQPRSHGAVAAAVAQGRADWGMAIRAVAEPYGLAFIPYGDEHYDFAIPKNRIERPAVKAFLKALAEESVRAELRRIGFEPA